MEIIKKIIKNKFLWSAALLLIFLITVWYWPQEKLKLNYGVSFSSKYAEELKLDPKKTFEEMVTDLNIKKVRLVAYWDNIQATEGVYDFTDLDWQIEMAKKYNLKVILAVGKRVPRWPECHVPNWALEVDKEKQEEAVLKLISETVNRYKDSGVVKVWQVENEPFLTGYAKQYCGKFDKEFLEKEIALVKELDPKTPILMTDSGELSLWYEAYKKGDHFGATFYIYVANHFFGDMRMIWGHNWYRVKMSAMKLFFGEKPSYLIEISVEPWLTKPIIQTPISEQLQKMNVERLKYILSISSQTGFTDQYLWGVEWWYYLKVNGHSEIWDYIKGINKI
jgi:hypothetical protein